MTIQGHKDASGRKAGQPTPKSRFQLHPMKPQLCTLAIEILPRIAESLHLVQLITLQLDSRNRVHKTSFELVSSIIKFASMILTGLCELKVANNPQNFHPKTERKCPHQSGKEGQYPDCPRLVLG